MSNSQTDTLGLSAFDSLRAEDEEWLLQAFVPPSEFELMNSTRSVIIFGEAGSGKTAAHRTLSSNSFSPDGKLQRLLVGWHPAPLLSGVQIDSLSVRGQLAQILDACAMAILTYLVRHPLLFGQAPPWAQGFMIWFIRQHLQGDFELRTGSLTLELDESGQALLTHLATCSVREAFSPEAAHELIIAELVKVLQKIELQGAWVLVDGLEAWSEAEPERLADGFRAFLSALNLFERPGFAYKIFLPVDLERRLAGVGGVTRRRVDAYRLHWSVTELTELVERRLAVASDGKIQTLAELCEDKGLTIWLERCGANSPRGWLQYIRPLVGAYFDQARRTKRFEPITSAAWKEIRQRHPPPLILDEHTRQVIVGWREVKDIPDGPYKLLHYLYRHSGQVCSKSTLYYLAYLGLEREPLIPSDPGWEAPKAYVGMIDTAIWRLRQAIEPDPQADPKDCLFVATVRGQGVRLENAR